MSNLSKGDPPKKPIFFTILADGIFRQKLFNVFSDGSFTEVDIIYVRIDNVLEKPLRILVNDQEWSITINDEIGILCKGQEAVEELLEELYFVMEEFHNLEKEHRTTSEDKIVEDMTKMLGYKVQGEKNGKELNDQQDQQKQSD